MALNNYNNSTTLNLFDKLTDEMDPALSYTLSCIGFLISVYGVVANVRLLFHQHTVAQWFDQDRPLIIGILLANTLSSFTHLCLFIVAFFYTLLVITINYSLEKIVAIADVGATISTCYTATLAFRGLNLIKSQYDCTSNVPKAGKDVRVHLAHSFWLLALIFALFGLNADNMAMVQRLPQLTSDIIYYSIMVSLQIIVMCCLIKTRRYAKKLEGDFVVNRAQQSLKTRVSLNRTMKRTQILIPQLAVHALLWLLLLSANFVIDTALVTGPAQGFTDTNGQHTDSMWVALMDCLEALIYAIYPMLLTRTPGSPWKNQIVRAIACRYNLKVEPLGKGPAIVATVQSRGSQRNSQTSNKDAEGAHWQAMDALWSRVEVTKGIAKAKELKQARQTSHPMGLSSTGKGSSVAAPSKTENDK